MEIHFTELQRGSRLPRQCHAAHDQQWQSATWENITYNLQELCRGGIAYVDDVSTMPQPAEGSISDLLSTPAEHVLAYAHAPTNAAPDHPDSTPG